MRSQFARAGRGGYRRRLVPGEGTRLREVYDLFCANKGTVILEKGQSFNNNVNQLRDFYEMDIRCLRKEHIADGGFSRWVLVGEWFGDRYVDYVAGRMGL